MNGFLLDSLDLKRVELHIKHLAEIHNNRLVDLLPQVSSEDLNQRNLKSRNFTVHEYASKIKLDLEANINISSVDSWRPPESEPSVRDLVQSRSLSMSQLLILHRLLEARSLLPEKSFPSREICSLKERML